MKSRFAIAAIFAAVLSVPAAAVAASPGSSGAVAHQYYVSLGDSLAAGTQPGQFSSNEGYADQLAAALQTTTPNLVLVKLGCPGETTAGMITPDLPFEGRNAHDPCHYPHGSQLAEAVNFLHAHRQFVKLVTIDIGPNDLFRGGGVPAVAANLPVILAALREAAGPGVPILGMNFYDPFLADVWFAAPAALPAEVASIVALNNFFEGIYAAAGDPVADVESAFSTTNTSLVGGTPFDVLRICAWTWECSPAHDIHPNAIGYGVIAQAFLEVLN